MPVNKGVTGSVESQVYSMLRSFGYNIAICCGILANIEKESSFNPKAVGDGGKAYGLCQWNSRRESLFKYSRGGRNPSISQQVNFINYEFRHNEKKAYNIIRGQSQTDSEASAYNAGYNFCVAYERPQYSDTKGRERGILARDKYYKYYSKNPNPSIVNVNITGSDIARIARECIGDNYKPGGSDPKTGFDAPGFLYYCYKTAGKDIGEDTISGFYRRATESWKSIPRENVSGGDILFFERTDDDSGSIDSEIIGIALNSNTMVYVDIIKKKVIETSIPITRAMYAFRYLPEAEVSADWSGGYIEESGVNPDGIDALEYTSLSNYDINALTMTNNLSRVKATGFDYGYLIDLTYGGEFKFYIPEFSESAGANWESINIRGRSVSVLSYNNTDSRKIQITLDLYAGVGLYAPMTGESGEDTVSRLHKDAYFLKSLEYPDYSNAISRPPSTVHLILGSAVNIAGVVSGVSVEHLKPLDEYNRAMYLKVSFTVTQTAVNPVDYRDVRRGHYSLISTEDIDSISTTDSTNAPVYSGKEWSELYDK